MDGVKGKPAILAALAAVPLVAAATTTGISPLNQAFDLIGSFFNLQLSNNTLIGVVKFLLFLLIFSLLNWAARSQIWKGNDPLAKRTANIVAFVLALISIFFIPNKSILDISSIWTAAIWAIIILFIPVALVWYSFKMTSDKPSTGSGDDS